jgi:competence protein ComEC
MTIIYLTLAWVAGIVFAVQIDEKLPYGIAAIGVAVALIWFRARHQLALILSLALLFLLGGLRLEEARPINSPDHIVHLNSQGVVTIFGVVTEEPDERDTYTNLRVEVDEVQALGTTHATHGTVLVRFPAQSDVQYGDRVQATGTLLAPAVLDTFDYRDKLARQGIFSTMQPISSRIIGHDEGNWFRETLIDIKTRAQDLIEDALSEPQASLLSGVLLGDDKGLPFTVKDAFNATGTSHVIAISGFNMTLIAVMVSSLLKAMFKSGMTVVLISIGVMSIYTIFVGASGAVVRAAVMSGILITAEAMQRRTFVPASLAATAIIMSLLDPWVLWDIGFQLSFAAVLGMALLTPSLDRSFTAWMQHRLGDQTGTQVSKWLSEPLIVGLAAQVFTLPIILFYFGRLSLISPVVNLLIVPIQAFILFFGGAATLISFVLPSVGEIFYQTTWLFLSWTTEIVRRFAKLSIASTEVSITQWVFITFAGAALVLTILNATRPPWYDRWWQLTMQKPIYRRLLQFIPIIGLIVLSLLIPRILRQPDDKLHVTYLDMGQTNSALVQSPDGAVLLINGGRFPSRLLTALGDQLPPNYKQIDVLFITSDERDDIGGLVEVVKRYDIQAVMTGVQNSAEEDYFNLMGEIERRDIPVIQATDGWRIQTGDGVVAEILAPNENEDVVIRLQYDEAIFLFTTSIALSEEESLVSNPSRVQATVLQAADQAADDSNSDAWVQTVNPQVVIVHNDPSSRELGAIGHVMARFDGRHVFRTDRHGTIEIITDGKTLEIQPENEG